MLKRTVIVCLAATLFVGCEGGQNFLSRGDVDIKALEATWPPYRAPSLTDETLPVKTQNPILPSDQRRPYQRPELDTGIRVIKPYREWDLAETAIDSLGRIGAPAVPSLSRTLRHPNPQSRLRAALILARIGPNAKGAVSALVQTLNDPDPEVRRAATRALGQIGPAAGEAVDPLLQMIEQESAMREDLPQ